MRSPILIVLLASASAHGAFLALTHARLQPHYFEAGASLERNTLNAIGTDASTVYGRYAEAILQRGAYETTSGPVTSHMPGTSLVLALSKGLTGNLALYGLLQSLALFAAVYYVCCSAAAVSSQTVVLLSATFYLLHPLMVYLSWTVNSDAFFIAASLPAISLLTRPDLDPRRALIAAGLLGIATYFREAGMILAVFAALSLIRFNPPRLKLGLLFFGAFLGILSPWIIRNYLSTGELIITTTKGAKVFFLSSLGLNGDVLNPLDPGHGGEIDYEALSQRSREYLEAQGVKPGQSDPDTFYVWHGIKNYVTRPGLQARSLVAKGVNLLRPGVARRHISRIVPGWLSAIVYWLLAMLHAALLWVGLFVLFGRRRASEKPLRWMFIGTVAFCLAVWAEPRYLLPFYLPVFIIAIDFYLSGLRVRRAARFGGAAS